VNQVQGVGDGVENNPRTAEDTGSLADSPSEALFVAFDRERRISFTENLLLATF
jgi:hypothetical protein